MLVTHGNYWYTRNHQMVSRAATALTRRRAMVMPIIKTLCCGRRSRWSLWSIPASPLCPCPTSNVHTGGLKSDGLAQYGQWCRRPQRPPNDDSMETNKDVYFTLLYCLPPLTVTPTKFLASETRVPRQSLAVWRDVYLLGYEEHRLVRNKQSDHSIYRASIAFRSTEVILGRNYSRLYLLDSQPHPVEKHRFPPGNTWNRDGRQTGDTASLNSTGWASFSSIMSLENLDGVPGRWYFVLRIILLTLTRTVKRSGCDWRWRPTTTTRSSERLYLPKNRKLCMHINQFPTSLNTKLLLFFCYYYFPFLPCDFMLARYMLSSCVCSFVCPSGVEIVSSDPDHAHFRGGL